jgi:hypothetical protein
MHSLTNSGSVLRQVDVKPAFLQHRSPIGEWTICRLFGKLDCSELSMGDLAILRHFDNPGKSRRI